jgi:hypothetical protein
VTAWTRRRVLALVPGAVALHGCGYALVGKGVTTDPSIKRIGVPLFRDATGKPTLDQKITQRVIEELLKRGRFDVVQERTGVDATVEGDIVRYDVVPVGFTGADAAGQAQGTQASRYAITLTAKVIYAKVGSTEPIWSHESFQSRDEYDLGSDPATFTDREVQALDRLATTFARNLVAEMLEAF